MNPIKQFKRECPTCTGTGLYQGMCERGSLAVVCNQCDGQGFSMIQYRVFTGRTKREGVTHVIARATGVALDENYVPKEWMITADEFYESLASEAFSDLQKQLRPYSCPAQVMQQVLNRSASDLVEPLGCPGFGYTFTSCKYYEDKAHCWAKVDTQNLFASKDE